MPVYHSCFPSCCQRGKLLPVGYFMVTFTLPYQLRQLVWQHQRIGYDLLLKFGWQTLMQFGSNDPQLIGRIGALPELTGSSINRIRSWFVLHTIYPCSL
jgi:hypothetical protein